MHRQYEVDPQRNGQEAALAKRRRQRKAKAKLLRKFKETSERTSTMSGKFTASAQHKRLT